MHRLFKEYQCQLIVIFFRKKILQINIQLDYAFTALDSKYLMVSIFLPYNYYMHIPKLLPIY